MRDLENGYEEYKFNDYLKTELPSHWINKRLSYLAREDKSAFVDGPFGSDLKSSDYIDSGVPLIQLNNIRDSKHVMQNLKFITEEKKLQLNRHLAIPGDVVIAKMADPVARSAVVRDYFYEYVIVADCVKMSPNLHLVNLEYLVWAINCDYVRINAELVATGTTRIRVNLGELKKLKIPYPPLDEQQKIANFLDHETAKIDTLIAKQQQLIQLLKEKRQAVISHAVTKGLNPDAPMRDSGVEWLGAVPAHWDVKPLRYLGTCQNGINIGAEFFGSGYPFVSYVDAYKTETLPEFGSGLVQSTEHDRKVYSVILGDVIFTRTSETIEEIGLSSTCLKTIDDATFAGFLIRFRPTSNLLDSGFSKYYFRNKLMRTFFTKQMNIVTRASLSQGLLKKLPVPLPSLNEQMEISEFLDNKSIIFDKLTERTKNAIEFMQERRIALISAAVTGKIDVRNWVSPDASSTANTPNTPNTSDSTATTNTVAVA